MINWRNDGKNDRFDLGGFHFILEFGADIVTAKAKYPNFIMMKSKELVNTYCRILGDRTRQFENILELGIMKGGSPAFFNILASPQNHLAIDVYKQESGLDRFSEDVRKSGRALVADYATSQGDTQIILKKFSEISGTQPRFDFVVDDASHNFGLSLSSFNGLFPHVREGGIYALEDWGWAHWGGPWQQPDHGEFENPALSNIVFLASLCCTSSPGVISRVEVTPGTTLIYRGPAPLGRDFSLENTYLARGKKLQFI